mmetsp:Transcript_28863/g.73646  ORF Transcript_28863/g.73646 Transcript_28863/m.73646 type:complete len:231 (+) Transcript_28863:109-801(+)
MPPPAISQPTPQAACWCSIHKTHAPCAPSSRPSFLGQHVVNHHQETDPDLQTVAAGGEAGRGEDDTCRMTLWQHGGVAAVSQSVPHSGNTRGRRLSARASMGQYGHLNTRARDLAILSTLCSHSTWLQGSRRGGLSGVDWSLDTGQAKMGWNTNSGPRPSSSQGSWVQPDRSCWLRSSRAASLVSGGSAAAPAATATDSGDSAACPIRLHATRPNSAARSSHASSPSKAA